MLIAEDCSASLNTETSIDSSKLLRTNSKRVTIGIPIDLKFNLDIAESISNFSERHLSYFQLLRGEDIRNRSFRYVS